MTTHKKVDQDLPPTPEQIAQRNGNTSTHPRTITDASGRVVTEHRSGITKREYFSAIALQGILAGYADQVEEYSIREDCVAAIQYADELLLQLQLSAPKK